MDEKIQGDITFCNGRSFHFENRNQFAELFFENIGIALHDCYYKKPRQLNICTYFFLDEIEYQLMITTDFKIPIGFKLFGDLIEQQIGLNIKTHKDFYNNEIKKILTLFESQKSNIASISLVENKFDKAKKRLLFNEIETIFDDSTAISICKKIQTPFIRGLLKSPNANMKFIHKIAMNCYLKYGGHVITFLLRLPILEFANRRVKETKTYKNEDGLIPAFRIKYANETVVLRFYQKKFASTFKTNAVVATVDNNKREIFTIGYDGKLNDKVRNEGKKISLFIEV